MGNPVKIRSGPAAVIPISTIRNSESLHAERHLSMTGKASRDRESQKTCLKDTSRRSLRGKRCEGKGHGFYPQLSLLKAGVFVLERTCPQMLRGALIINETDVMLCPACGESAMK